MSPPVEIKWFWRRWFVFGFTAVNCIGVAAVIWKLSDPMALKWVGLGLISSNMVLALLYIAGASGTDIARVVAAARSGTEPPEDKPDKDSPNDA